MTKKGTKVVNKRAAAYDTYIGRGSVFGNPYKIGEDGNRRDVIERYREYFYDRIGVDPAFRHQVLALKGQVLGCFCAPQACHGDVIVEFLEGGPPNEDKEQLSLF